MKYANVCRAALGLSLTSLFLLGSGVPGCASGGDSETTSGGYAAVDSGSGATGGASGSGSDATGGSAGASGAGGSSGTAGVGGASGSGGSTGSGGAPDTGTDTGSGGETGTDAAGAAGAAGTDGGVDSGFDSTDPCAVPESCNGLDDNCNGAIDEGDPDGGGACTVFGKQGVCTDGVLHCTQGVLACVQSTQPSPETCNGLDDNCNGAVDEGNPEGNKPCNTGLQGVCVLGTSQCAQGALGCIQNVQSSTEVCNGLDDDCDGVPDDGFGGGQPCTVLDALGAPLKGPCASGLTNCLGGQAGCTQTVFGSSDTCNGIDDDCDGTIDQNLSGQACDTGQLGECMAGTTTCAGGVSGCAANKTATTETCNDKDDDCNGTVDDIANVNGECSAKNTSAGQVGAWKCVTGFCAVDTCNTNFANCDGAPANGCETNLQSTTSDCGSCGLACDSTHGVAFCTLGACGIQCLANYGDCDTDASTGCETQTSNNTSNCGGCGITCTNSHGPTQCNNSVCLPTCNGGYGDCNGNPMDGCETSTDSSTANCGGCGLACINPNGSTSCNSGTCSPVCDPGSDNCDGNLRNGCEADTNNGVLTCGGCNTKCLNANGSTGCAGGVCQPLCGAGAGDCDGNPINGCETNTNSSTSNCGSCGSTCSAVNGTNPCVLGACSPVCAGSYQNCDGFPNNGCESNRLTDVSNCGGCNIVCDNPNGATSCVNGVCKPVCDPGYKDCDGDKVNGCEQDVYNDPAFCGTCTNSCSNTHGTTGCALGVCTPTCAAGFQNCDSNPTNGCEQDVFGDVSHCGTCTTVCSNPGGSVSCVGGVCQPGCTAPYGNCDGNNANGCETNTSFDPNNCNGCNLKCDNAHGTNSCFNATCAPICTGTWRNCDGNGYNGCEDDTSTDVDNCGACTKVCANAHGSTSCLASACKPVCTAPWLDCDGNPDNGCETDGSTDKDHCGVCTTACTNPNGSTLCSAGTCSPSCSAGALNCDGNVVNGCEAAVNSDVNNCGACGTKCLNPNGGTICSAGNCSPTCNAPFKVCTGNPNNGCLVNTGTDPNNCGSCGATCDPQANTSGTNCTASACTVTSCQGGYENYDGSYANGCECQADAPSETSSNTCTGADGLVKTVAVDASLTGINGNLTSFGDVDWYKVVFTVGPVCSLMPKIALTGSAAQIQVYTDCGGGNGGGSQSCADSGNSGNAGLDTWELTYAGTGCGAMNTNADPTPGTGGFITIGMTMYIKVSAKGGATTTTCRPYTITFSS